MCFGIRMNRDHYRHTNNGVPAVLFILLLTFVSLALPMLDLALSRASVAEMRLATYELGLTLSTLTSAVSAQSSGTSLVLEFAEVLEPELPILGALALSVYDNSTNMVSIDLPELVYESRELIHALMEMLGRMSDSMVEDSLSLAMDLAGPSDLPDRTLFDRHSEFATIMQIFNHTAQYRIDFVEPICAKATSLLTSTKEMETYLRWSTGREGYAKPGQWHRGKVHKLPTSMYLNFAHNLCGGTRSALVTFEVRFVSITRPAQT